MSHRYLLLSLFLLSTMLLPLLWRLFLCALFLCYWYYRFRDDSWIYCALICMYLLFAAALPHNGRLYETYHVEKIGSYHMILKHGSQMVYCKKAEGVIIDDVLRVEGELIPFSDTSSFYTAGRKKIYASQSVYYELRLKQWEITGKRQTLRRKFYEHLSAQEPSERQNYLKWILFRETEEETGDMAGVLKSSGICLSAAFSALETLCGWFLLPEQIDTVFGLLFLWLGWRTHVSCTLFRIAFKRLLRMVNERDDRLGIRILFLLCVNPAYCNSLSFQIPVLLELLSFYTSKRRPLDSAMVLLPLQLNSFYTLNLTELLLYPLLRWGMLACCVLSALPFSFLDPVIRLFWSLSEKLPVLTLSGKPGTLWLMGYYALLSVFFQKRKIKTGLLLMAMLLFNQYQSFFTPFSSGVFLNVGHGDCFLYHDAFSSEVLMIDTGSAYQYSRVKNYLNAKGIRRIGLLILTHEDEDHSGNYEALMKDFVLEKCVSEKTEEYRFRNHVIREYLVEKTYESANANSQICGIRLSGLNYLFTGDITKEVEEELIPKLSTSSFDILKAAHHGSKTSSSEAFLRSLSPRIVILSCKEGVHGLPDEEVLLRLEELRLPYYRTDEEGDISILSDFGLHFLYTSSGTLLRIP